MGLPVWRTPSPCAIPDATKGSRSPIHHRRSPSRRNSRRSISPTINNIASGNVSHRPIPPLLVDRPDWRPYVSRRTPRYAEWPSAHLSAEPTPFPPPAPEPRNGSIPSDGPILDDEWGQSHQRVPRSGREEVSSGEAIFGRFQDGFERQRQERERNRAPNSPHPYSVPFHSLDRFHYEPIMRDARARRRAERLGRARAPPQEPENGAGSSNEARAHAERPVRVEYDGPGGDEHPYPDYYPEVMNIDIAPDERRSQLNTGREHRASSSGREREREREDTVPTQASGAVVDFPPLRRMGQRTTTDGPGPSSLRESWSPAVERTQGVVDGLGDRQRSISSTTGGSEANVDNWETMFSNIVPDEHLPSADSSFTSAAASASFSASNEGSRARSADSSSNSATSSRTHITVPEQPPSGSGMNDYYCPTEPPEGLSPERLNDYTGSLFIDPHGGLRAEDRPPGPPPPGVPANPMPRPQPGPDPNAPGWNGERRRGPLQWERRTQFHDIMHESRRRQRSQGRFWDVWPGAERDPTRREADADRWEREMLRREREREQRQQRHSRQDTEAGRGQRNRASSASSSSSTSPSSPEPRHPTSPPNRSPGHARARRRLARRAEAASTTRTHSGPPNAEPIHPENDAHMYALRQHMERAERTTREFEQQVDDVTRFITRAPGGVARVTDADQDARTVWIELPPPPPPAAEMRGPRSGGRAGDGDGRVRLPSPLPPPPPPPPPPRLPPVPLLDSFEYDDLLAYPPSLDGGHRGSAFRESEVEQMGDILRQLAGRDDIPENWWVGVGLRMAVERARRGTEEDEGSEREGGRSNSAGGRDSRL